MVDMNNMVPLLIISGSMGSGKTTVLSEISDLLARANTPHAAIDLDWLSIMHPPQDRYGEQLVLSNLAAIWPIYVEAGAKRLVVARVVENRSELSLYRDAVPGAEPIVCRLEVDVGTMQERLRVREPGMFQDAGVARSAELADILRVAQAEDFTVDNNSKRHITDVAREVLSLSGWL